MTNALSLQMRLFGSLELTLTDKPAPPGSGKIRQQAAGESVSCAPSSATAQSVVAYLIVYHERRVPREKLVGLFWPDRPSSRARHALSHAIWQIRDSLGPASDRLITDRDTVTFATQADDWIDVEEFEARLGGATGETSVFQAPIPAAPVHSLTSAAQLYRGEFLDAIYDDWALVERERLRELYLRALERLTTLHKQLGDYEQALIWAQRLVHADPLRERGHQEVMRLYHLLGRSRAALQQFDSLRCLLNRELDVEPSAASVALHQEITLALEEAGVTHLPLLPSPPPLLRNLAHLPFVGRTRERAALVDALQAAVQGHGGVVLIEGEPGVGKTRLVQEIIAMARWRGFQTGLGKAESSAASPPYQPLSDALSPQLTPLRVAQLTELIEPLWLSAAVPLLPAIAEQLPDLPPLPALDPQKEQRRLREGLSRCLRGLASLAPLLLVLEDLHWADEATLSGIPHLVRRLSSSRTLTVLTYRPAESHERNVVWATLDALDRALPVQRVRLSPFERSEAVALILRALGAGPTDSQASAFAQRLKSEIGGNALFLVETLRSLLEKGYLAPTSSSASTGWTFPAGDWPISTPTSIRQLLRTRVTRLPSELHCALELVAVLGEHADVPALVDATDTSSVELLAALGELQRRGLLRETERQYRIGHDRMREVFYQSISRERRQELHRQVGTTLEKLHPDQIEILGYHFSRGQVWQKAAVYSKRAGDRATVAYAHGDAAAHYTRALEALRAQPEPVKPVQHFELLLAREAARGLRGDREGQGHDLKALTALAEELRDNRRQAKVALRQASYYDVTSNYARTIDSARSAVKWASQGGDPTLAAKGHNAWGRALWLQGDHSSARMSYERALGLARAAGARECEAECLQSLGVVHYDLNEHATAREYLERSLAIRHSLDDQYGKAESLNSLGNVCCDLGEHLAARDYYRQSLALKRAVGDRRGEAHVLYNLSVFHRDLGDGEAARWCCEEALSIAQETGDQRLEAYVLTYLALVLERLHTPESPSEADLATAEKHYTRALAIRRQIGQPTLAIDSLAGLARVALAEGRMADARHRADEALDWIAEHGPAGIGDVQLVYQSVYRVLRADGKDEQAKEVLSAAYDLLMEWAAGLDNEMARHSLLEEVWPNREIVAAHRAMARDGHVRRLHIRLPVADAPTGRPLRDDEHVEVTWTVAVLEDDDIPGKVARRRHRVLRLLRQADEQSAAPSIGHLAEALDVSARTIRRDLAALRARGHDVRTRGSHATLA